VGKSIAYLSDLSQLFINELSGNAQRMSQIYLGCE
jgi:hypothetical protein